jgi:uncharacterized protein
VNSAIYTGRLRHRRFTPREHEFSYRLFMMYIDLAELDQVFAKRWCWSVKRPALAWLKRSDYLGDPTTSLDSAVRDRVELETGTRPRGPIRMLTHLRYFGLSFNPVTFYYCFDRDDACVEYTVAEITNTPWKERHAYVLPRTINTAVLGNTQRFQFKKAFHVSPFNPMQMDYDWRFSAPGERLTVHMQNLQNSSKVFDATLDVTRKPITAASLAWTLIRFPMMTATVVIGIHWQALKLWLKRMPFYSHSKSDVSATASSSAHQQTIHTTQS